MLGSSHLLRRTLEEAEFCDLAEAAHTVEASFNRNYPCHTIVGRVEVAAVMLLALTNRIA